MKKSINIIILGICFLVMQSRATAGKLIPDTFILEIEGRIANADEGDGITNIELICDNFIIESIVLRDRKMFTLNLKRNTNYTIRLSKTGFVDRLICVNTTVVPFYDDDLYRFSFETRLINKKASERMKKDVLDMPIAMVYYDEKKDCFYYSKTYTSNIKKELALK